MNCDQVEEYVSALCDGEKIPSVAAEHIGTCSRCGSELQDYASIGAELRRLGSLNERVPCPPRERGQVGSEYLAWWQRGLTTMRIPKLAFAAMLLLIISLSSGLVLVRAKAGAMANRFLELKYKLPTTGTPDVCVMSTNGNQKDNLCNFVYHGREGLFLMYTRLISTAGDHAELAIRAKYIPGAGDTQVNYSEDLFRDIREQVLSLEPGETRGLEVANLGTVEFQGNYLDHLPALVYRPQEKLDPTPNEFRVVDPVFVRDDRVIAKVDGSSLDDGSSDATLMLYVPGEGRYLLSITPFEGAVVGEVHLGQIRFSLDGHAYLLLTSMPITRSPQLWVKHEPDFKPSERMVNASDARDDRPMFLVRSLNTLEK